MSGSEDLPVNTSSDIVQDPPNSAAADRLDLSTQPDNFILLCIDRPHLPRSSARNRRDSRPPSSHLAVRRAVRLGKNWRHYILYYTYHIILYYIILYYIILYYITLYRAASPQACLEPPLNEYRELMYSDGSWYAPSVTDAKAAASAGLRNTCPGVV